MKEWHIWDFPGNLYVLVRGNTRDEFFKAMYNRFGSQLNYAKFLGKDRNCIQGYHYGRSWDNGDKHVKFVPLKVFHKSIQFLDKSLRKKIERDVLEIRTHGGKSIKKPLLPIKESPSLYRVVAHVIGDGNDSHTPYYANMCKELRDQFKRDLQIFGEVFYMENTPNTTPCVNFPKVVTRILSHILDIQFTHPNRLPEAIFNAPDDCKAAFLQALYDDEGTISANLAICIHNKNILNQLKTLLQNFGIKTGKITTGTYFTKKGKRLKCAFQIYKDSYKKFQEKVCFVHPKKARYLEAALRTKSRVVRTRDPIIVEQEILKILETKPSRTMELANNLQFTMSGITPHLNRLSNEGLIIHRGYKNAKTWDIA
jgi:hypothetical protein